MRSPRPADAGHVVRSEIRRPGAEQGLVKEVFDIAVGDDLAVDFGSARAIEAQPLRHPVAPIARHLGQQREPHARVLAALGVVCGCRHHCPRPRARPLLGQMMEGSDRRAKAPRIAADLVEREQTEVTVVRGVLKGLRHHRPGHLLEVHRRAQRPGTMLVKVLIRRFAGEHRVEKVEDAQVRRALVFPRQCQSPFDVTAIVRAGALRRNIGPVHRKRRDDLFQCGQHATQCEVPGPPLAHRQLVKLLGKDVHLAGEVDLHDAFLAGIKDVVEALVRIGEPAVKYASSPLHPPGRRRGPAPD